MFNVSIKYPGLRTTEPAVFLEFVIRHMCFIIIFVICNFLRNFILRNFEIFSSFHRNQHVLTSQKIDITQKFQTSHLQILAESAVHLLRKFEQ